VKGNDIVEISKMPCSVTADEMTQYLKEGCRGVHESLMRSYHIVHKVKELLEAETPPKVVLEIMDLMQRNLQDGLK
jgi:hypothetical protein